MQSRSTAFFAACLAALLAISAPSVCLAADDLPPTPAPDFTLPGRDGKPVSLSQYRGQVVMVNFWASWCGPCRQEFPVLDQLYKKYKPMGFTLLGVNVESETDLAQKFLAQTPASFPILFDRQNATSKLYGVSAMPTTLLVDRKGNVRWLHRAYKPGDENLYLNAVRGLLREK
jgi:thiol-disulfide isomerase/thioredoxin